MSRDGRTERATFWAGVSGSDVLEVPADLDELTSDLKKIDLPSPGKRDMGRRIPFE